MSDLNEQNNIKEIHEHSDFISCCNLDLLSAKEYKEAIERFHKVLSEDDISTMRKTISEYEKSKLLRQKVYISSINDNAKRWEWLIGNAIKLSKCTDNTETHKFVLVISFDITTNELTDKVISILCKNNILIDEHHTDIRCEGVSLEFADSMNFYVREHLNPIAMLCNIINGECYYDKHECVGVIIDNSWFGPSFIRYLHKLLGVAALYDIPIITSIKNTDIPVECINGLVTDIEVLAE